MEVKEIRWFWILIFPSKGGKKITVREKVLILHLIYISSFIYSFSSSHLHLIYIIGQHKPQKIACELNSDVTMT